MQMYKKKYLKYKNKYLELKNKFGGANSEIFILMDQLRITNPGVTMTTRVIDQRIHSLYNKNPTRAEHFTHQIELLRFTEGNEIAIFNDPLVVYSENHHNFNGVTGTMSSILTSGFIYLYSELLEKGVNINPLDIYRLYYFSAYIKINERNQIQLNKYEFTAMKNIYRQLKILNPENELFAKKFWDDYQSEMARFIENCRVKKIEISQRLNGDVPHNFETFNYCLLINKNTDYYFYNYEKEKEKLTLMYEYIPPFLNERNQNNYGVLFRNLDYTIEEIMSRLKFMKEFFLNNDSITRDKTINY